MHFAQASTISNPRNQDAAKILPRPGYVRFPKLSNQQNSRSSRHIMPRSAEATHDEKEGKKSESQREGLGVAVQAQGRPEAANWTAAGGGRRRERRARCRLFLAFQLDSFPLQPSSHKIRPCTRRNRRFVPDWTKIEPWSATRPKKQSFGGSATGARRGGGKRSEAATGGKICGEGRAAKWRGGRRRGDGSA